MASVAVDVEMHHPAPWKLDDASIARGMARAGAGSAHPGYPWEVAWIHASGASFMPNLEARLLDWLQWSAHVEVPAEVAIVSEAPLEGDSYEIVAAADDDFVFSSISS